MKIKIPRLCRGSNLGCGEREGRALKNSPVGYFSEGARLQGRNRRGITFGDPVRGFLAAQITPLFASLIWSFYFHLYSLRQAWFVQMKIKIPRLCRGSNLGCGEREGRALKNSPVGYFSEGARLQGRNRRGITFGDPVRGFLTAQITPLFASLIWSFYFHLYSLRQAWFVQMKIKIPRLCRGSNLGCGERGIRTPGSVVTDQRFSRPPHSTTLPFLRRKDNILPI